MGDVMESDGIVRKQWLVVAEDTEMGKGNGKCT